MRKYLRMAWLVASALLFVSTFAWAVGPSEIVIFPGTSDPCQNPALLKSSVSVNITNSTAELIAAVPGKTVYVCAFNGVAAGVTPALQLLTGTKTTNPCDTGAASLTGLMSLTSGNSIFLHSGSTLVKSAAGGELCGLVSGSATANFSGVMDYIQQ